METQAGPAGTSQQSAKRQPAARHTARLTRKESQEATRRRLTESAIELFATNGVAATSLNAVAEHAGFSRGAIHGNFSGKDELCTAVIATVTGALQPELTTILTAQCPATDRLANYIRAFLAYCDEHQAQASALVNVVGYFNQAHREFYGNLADDSLADLEALFREGQAHGQMRRFDPHTMAFALRTVLDNTAASPAQAAPMADELVTLFDRATRAH